MQHVDDTTVSYIWVKCHNLFLAGLLNRGHKLATGARVIRDSDISMLPVSGTH